VNESPRTKRSAASHLAVPTWRERFAIRVDGFGRVLVLAWFVWLPIVAAVATLLVGVSLRDIGYIAISLVAKFLAFLMCAFFRTAMNSVTQSLVLPNPAVNADAPSAALRAGRRPPVTLFR
jgi:hypothetical protein